VFVNFKASLVGRIVVIFKLLFALCILAAPVGTASAEDDGFTVMVFGDSLSAAYGMASSSGWVALLAERVADRDVTVVNRSVSGETTAGGLRRLPAALDEVNPDLVIIELGANDGLRGLNLAVMRANLTALIERSRDSGAKVLLLGMRLPPNYGPAYTEAFESSFEELAERLEVAFVPFFLEPVAEDWDMMQDDGIHPNAAAQPIVLSHLWPTLRDLLPHAQQTATR
jgi:acyl-CoA thioesterase-1